MLLQKLFVFKRDYIVVHHIEHIPWEKWAMSGTGGVTSSSKKATPNTDTRNSFLNFNFLIF